jgi:hypothetical protein
LTLADGGVGAHEGVGLSVLDGSRVEGTRFSVEDNGIGIYGTGGSQLQLADGRVDGQRSAGALIEGTDTKMKLVGQNFSENTIGLQVREQAFVEIVGARFERNAVHVEVLATTNLRARDRWFGDSADGVGIYVTDGAKATFTECNLGPEVKAALSCEGSASLISCEVTDCDLCGVFVCGSASASLEDCTIATRGSCGVQAMEGAVTVKRTTIAQHHTFGIHLGAGAALTERGNVFDDNGLGDIHREGHVD